MLSLPSVQTRIARYLTEQVNKDFGTDIYVDQVAISIFGGVKLKKVLVRDHHKDTLFYITRFKTNAFDIKKAIDGDMIFGSVRIDGLTFNLKNYKEETNTNLDVFVDAFDDGQESSGKFLMMADKIVLSDSRFRMIDENLLESKTLDFSNLSTTLQTFKIKGSTVTMQIEEMSCLDYRGLLVKRLSTAFRYSKSNILLRDLDVITERSFLKGDVKLRYKKTDFTDFNNKVLFDIQLDTARLATNDIRYFYNELGADNHFRMKTNISGTLNDLNASNLHLIDDRRSEIIGDVNFRNLFAKEDDQFYMYGEFERVTSNYNDLTTLLPNVLGSKLPSSLNRIGQFTIKGKAEIMEDCIDTQFQMNTAIGVVESNLLMTELDHIDNAFYEGKIIFKKFHLGRFLDEKDLGLVSMDMFVKGKGFTEDFLDTHFKGTVSQLQYNNYNYTKIRVDGNFKKPIFNGELYVNDPNLFLDFDGIVDVTQEQYIYQFDVKIDYANLKALNFVRDSVSVFKGNIITNLSGNTLDDLQGELYFSKTSYQNPRDIYYFDDFKLGSYFDTDKERTITINSPDIIEGRVVGKFQFEEVPEILENSLGSLYSNYQRNKVSEGQYMRFNFSIYNKIIDIFFPELSFDANTAIRGSIDADNDDFKLDFHSPRIELFDNVIEKLQLTVDSKNPLFNTYLEMDSLKTKHYKIADFSMINVNSRDTLFFRSEFKGGVNNRDRYNINVYHTIDEEKNSVIGFQRSEFNFKGYEWLLNANDNKENRIVVDKDIDNIFFDNIVMTYEDQRMELDGYIRSEDRKKDLKLLFENVNIAKITPEIEGIALEGSLNGKVSIRQDKNEYKPISSLTVENLKINATHLGNLVVSVEGDESLSAFAVDASLKNDRLESFLVEGALKVVDKSTWADLDFRFNDFNIGAFSEVGGEIISDLRGFISGTAAVTGRLDNPDINGRMFLNKAGLGIPYLNVDYQMDEGSVVDITQKQFFFRGISLTDTRSQTKGTLNGLIEHDNLGDWVFDLRVDTDRMLVLDTKDHEDAIYFGRAFISGNALLKGPLDNLVIEVNAKSQRGTSIKLPISDSEVIGEKNYIRFQSPEEKYNQGEKEVAAKDYGGLELRFDLDITEDAEIDVILDRESGHGMRGRGRGSLLMEINTQGKFNMYGDFQVYEGYYNFRYRGLIDKRFEVKKFGSIVWDGDPLRARLNLEAVYETRTNPAVLLENQSFNRKIPVEVVIGVNGTIINPDLDFNFNFPSVSSVLKSEIQSKLDNKETRETQALYLLATSNFISLDGSLGQNAVTNNLFETLGGVLSDIFRDDDGKFSLGVDVVSADRTPGRETEGSVGVTTSFNINERISVNGKVGVPVGGITESTVVGNVEVLYRLNEEGTSNLRAFNRENDITFIGEAIGFTQGIGISYEVNFSSFGELIRKIFNNAQIKEAKERRADDLPDSDFSPDYIHFIDEKTKRQTEGTKTSTTPVEQVPEIE